MMANMGEQMALMNASQLVTDSIEESAAVLDVVGFNYADSRYELDAELFPHRVIVGSETFPERIDVMWDLVTRLPHVIGDFTWTGWDYLGEAGIGRVDYTDVEGYVPTGTSGPYPYLLAESGDIDITGHRRTISYYREIVFGLRSRAVHRGPPAAAPRPADGDDAVVVGRLGLVLDLGRAGGIAGVVDVYAVCRRGRAPARRGIRSACSRSAPTRRSALGFETEWRPGELVAVARIGGRGGRPPLAAHGRRRRGAGRGRRGRRDRR